MGSNNIDEWDGSMPGCHGKDCATSCCQSKQVPIYRKESPPSVDFNKKSTIQGIEIPFTINTPMASYNTTVLGKGEAEFLIRQNPGLLDVRLKVIAEIQSVEKCEGDGTVKFEIDYPIVMENCLGASGCKLKVKPLMCGLFPFGMDPENVLEVKGCPGSLEIAQKENTVRNILLLRKLKLNKDDWREYLASLDNVLLENGVKKEWDFLQDQGFLALLD